MDPGAQARPGSRQPTHHPAVQAFYAWIKDARVAIGQEEDTGDLDDFIPAGEVEAYLRKDRSRLLAILAALLGSEDSRWRGRTKEIVDRYSVVFAILVSIGRGHYILNFLPHDALCDDRLPFEARPRQFPWDDSDSDDLFDRFQAAQSRFCAVKFNLNSVHEFDEGRPLPFLKKKFLREGGSAKVYKVTVHASHDMLHGPTMEPASANDHRCYALKAYEIRGGKQWHDVETDAFKRLRRTGLEKTHMVGYYCSYKHGDRYYALLEYADMDTLERFMEQQRPPSMDTEIVAFWRSVLHVVEAISEIHDLDPDDVNDDDPFRFTAVHQDIKPTNILTKSKPNVSVYEYAFGLADLGTSSLIAAQSKRASKDNFGTKAYGPPECFRSDSWEYRRDINITPSIDIWSIACVISELCVWVMFGYSGPHGVEGYRHRRALHNEATPGAANCFHHLGKLSTAVSQEHKKILRQQRCDNTTRDILRVLPDLLQINPDDRWSAKKARDKFKRILERADTALASSERISQSAGTPVRHTTRPSRSTTLSSDASSPLLPHVNHRLSMANEGSQGETSVGASPTFDDRLTQTPRKMTMNGDPFTNGAGSLGIDPSTLSARVREAIQNTPPNEELPSTNTVLPDRTARVLATEQHNSERQPSTHMSHSHGPKNTPPNHAKGHLSATSDENVATHSPANESAATIDRAGPDNQPVPLQDQELASTPKPSTPSTPPARLSFRAALKWRIDAKAQRSVADLPNSHLLRMLEGRDHVFVVDDGQTMHDLRTINRQQHQSEVADYVDVLSYMVKRCDPDGIDLYYFNSSESVKESRNSTKLVISARGHKFSGISSPESSLVRILQGYSAKLNAYVSETRGDLPRSRKFHLPLKRSKVPKLPDPLSVYVLTDGVWQLGGGNVLEDTIKGLINNLRAAKCTRKQIGIQFIRFGDHPDGIERLNALDRLGRSPGLDMDIVDTEPVENGNVWKMLLGAIDERFDAD